jgi:beta-phosphoglucomutase
LEINHLTHCILTEKMLRALPQALIFDMDGTLIDNMDFHRRAFFAFLKKHGINVTDEEYERKNQGTITEIIPRFFGSHLSESQIVALGEEKEDLYREMYGPYLKPIKGLREFLEDAARKGIKMALATMGDRKNVRFTLEGLGIAEYFSAVVSGEEVRLGKPNPEVFLLAAAKLSVPPDECMAFEDSFSGIRSAISAGMRTVGVASTHTVDELLPFGLLQIIKDYTEIELATPVLEV